MIGNYWERTAEWGGSGGDGAPVPAWGNGYSGDGTYNFTNFSFGGSPQQGGTGRPISFVRGGAAFEGELAGVFHIAANYAPNVVNAAIGFRCVIPR